MKNFPSARALSLSIALAAAFGTAACSTADLSGNNLQTVSVSFAAGESSSMASLFDANVVASSTAAVPAITKVQLVLTKLELGRTDNVACVDDDEIEHGSSTPATDKGHDCEHVSRDPLLIDMPVDGTLHTQLNVPLAPGTYRKIEAKLEPVKSGSSAGAAFLAAHPGFVGISVQVAGTYNGAPFTYKSDLRAVIHMRFDPSLVIDATTRNATIRVDVSKWFLNGSEVIDPTKAGSGTSSARIVEKNIRASFHAFEDNGKHGKDNGEGHKGKSGDK
ncbi:MAG: hypothetical protein H0U64_10140 [Gemmatimonadaceae bacterium]|nr:hypothetical protein [Gemmatimonadaceae bacterium]